MLFGWLFVVLKSVIRLMQIDAEFWNCSIIFFLKPTSTNTSTFYIEVVISLPAIGPLKIEWGQETHNKSISEVTEMTMVLPKKPISPKRSQK